MTEGLDAALARKKRQTPPIEPIFDGEAQAQLIALACCRRIARGTVYDLPRPVPAADLELMRQIDMLPLEFPFAGARMLRGLLTANGSKVGRRHVKTLMEWMALYRCPRTTKPEPGYTVYPYLLCGSNEPARPECAGCGG